MSCNKKSFKREVYSNNACFKKQEKSQENKCTIQRSRKKDPMLEDRRK